jgi:hypothetical protein
MNKKHSKKVIIIEKAKRLLGTLITLERVFLQIEKAFGITHNIKASFSINKANDLTTGVKAIALYAVTDSSEN